MKNLTRIKKITERLTTLQKKCHTPTTKRSFIQLNTTFVVWLCSKYVIDLTKEIIMYTQNLDTVNNLDGAFIDAANLLREVRIKLS